MVKKERPKAKKKVTEENVFHILVHIIYKYWHYGIGLFVMVDLCGRLLASYRFNYAVQPLCPWFTELNGIFVNFLSS